MFPICLLLSPAAAGVKWGPVQDNLQLGIESTGPAIRLLLKNLGPQARDIDIGAAGSSGPLYNVHLAAVSAATEHRVFDVNTLRARPSSLYAPQTAHIQPGGAYVFTIPLDRLICIVDRKEIPLERLLRRGYSIRASFAPPNLSVVSDP